jgi:hypothetical protein
MPFTPKRASGDSTRNRIPTLDGLRALAARMWRRFWLKLVRDERTVDEWERDQF